MEEKKFRFATVLRRWDIANRILLILRMRYRNAGFSFAGLQCGAVPPFVGSIRMSHTGSCCHCSNTTEAHSAVFARIGTFFGSFIKLMFPFVGSIRMSRTGIGCHHKKRHWTEKDGSNHFKIGSTAIPERAEKLKDDSVIANFQIDTTKFDS